MKINAKETLEYYNQKYKTKTVHDDSFIFMQNERIYDLFTEYLLSRSFFRNGVNS